MFNSVIQDGYSSFVRINKKTNLIFEKTIYKLIAEGINWLCRTEGKGVIRANWKLKRSDLILVSTVYLILLLLYRSNLYDNNVILLTSNFNYKLNFTCYNVLIINLYLFYS